MSTNVDIHRQSLSLWLVVDCCFLPPPAHHLPILTNYPAMPLIKGVDLTGLLRGTQKKTGGLGTPVGSRGGAPVESLGDKVPQRGPGAEPR